MRRVCVLLPGSGREKIRRPNRIKYSSGEECAATIRLSNAEINPLTALALDLQSSESPSLFHRSYVYPFDRDKFDFACPPSLSLPFDDDIIVARAEEICVNYEVAFAARPASNPGARVRWTTPRMSYQAAQLNYETSITSQMEPSGWKEKRRDWKGKERVNRYLAPDGWGIDSQVLSRPKSYDVYRRFHLVTTPPYLWKN